MIDCVSAGWLAAGETGCSELDTPLAIRFRDLVDLGGDFLLGLAKKLGGAQQLVMLNRISRSRPSRS
jgi:hypothetical protein